jgi:ABC-2 type transport system ATP-binding protein
VEPETDLRQPKDDTTPTRTAAAAATTTVDDKPADVSDASAATPDPTPRNAPAPRKAPAKKPAAKKPAAKRAPRPRKPVAEVVLHLEGLTKRYGETVAVDGINLEVRAGSFYGIVGPNGAGKTTTLSMVTGLLRPDAGLITVHGADVWTNPVVAKRNMGVLPDRLRLFDRLTGAQLLHYSGTLRGLDTETVRVRSRDLAAAFGLEDALDRLVTDYSAGMTKKIALASAMIHSPRLLVLDEPFESVDPVSAANVIEILQRYTQAGGTVVLSSHSMDLVQRICDNVAIIVRGEVLAAGTMSKVRGRKSLEDRFVELAGGRKAAEGMEWLHSFSD